LVVVTGPDAISADALAYIVGLYGLHKGMALIEETPFFDALVVSEDDDAYFSKEMTGRVRLDSEKYGVPQPWPEEDGSSRDALDRTLSPLVQEHGLANCPATTLLYRPHFNLVLSEAPEGVSGEELRSAMQWRVRDLLDFPVEEAVIDVLPIPGVEIPGEGPPLFVVAARRETVKARVEHCREAGLELGSVDIPDMAHRNLAHLLPEDASGTCLVVLDAENPLISITKGGELIFSRQLGLDIREDFAALAAELGVDGEEARRLRVEHGLEGEPGSAGEGQLAGADPEPDELQLEEVAEEEADPLREMLTDFAERLALEVQRSLDYYDSRYRQAAIRKVHLAGEGARVQGLAGYLGSALDREFVFLDPLAHLPADEGLQSGAAAADSPVQEGIYAIGAGLRILGGEPS